MKSENIKIGIFAFNFLQLLLFSNMERVLVNTRNYFILQTASRYPILWKLRLKKFSLKFALWHVWKLARLLLTLTFFSHDGKALQQSSHNYSMKQNIFPFRWTLYNKTKFLIQQKWALVKYMKKFCNIFDITSEAFSNKVHFLFKLSLKISCFASRYIIDVIYVH